MISTACYPYPVSVKSSARPPALQPPHIYSPLDSHNSPRNTMYPHLHPSGSPSPTYIYSPYDQCYSKDSWLTAPPVSWPTFYPFPPRSSSLPETAVNPKVTIIPSQPVLVSDIDTPSSVSSNSVLTPSSPFTRHDVVEMGFQAMDFDEFDCDDEEDFIDSDFTDEMETVDEADHAPSLFYGASAPHVIKSTSSLEGALGDTLSSSYGSHHLSTFTPADRRLSASVPGYPSASHRATAATHQRCTEKAHSHALAPSSPSISQASYHQEHIYTQRNSSSSTTLLAPASPSLYNHVSSSSLAGAITSSVPSPHASRPTSRPLPILQPQPIRPIPPIPLADLASSADEGNSPESPCTDTSDHLRMLSPLPLLCQPVSDAIRYRLKEPSATGTPDDACYDEEGASESMCQDLIAPSGNDPFARQALTYCPQHLSAPATCDTQEKLYGRVHLPIGWQ